VYSVTKSVAIVAPPVAGFTASPEAGAAPLFVQFANTSTGANTLLWHFHDPANTTSQDPAPAFTFNALGDYVVDLDALNGAGCTDTYSKIIHAVVPNADAGLSNLQLIRDPATGQLQVLFVIDNHGNLPLVNPSVEVSISGNTTLKENLNLVVAPGQTASQLLTFSLMPSSVQYLCMTVEAGGDSNPANDKQCASADQGALVLSPYPNPVRSELHLDWIATGEGPARVTIFNSSGATAFDQQISSLQSGLNQLRVDVSQFSPGVYLVELVSPGFTKTFRFVVH
jgi:PKD repeat protein